MMSNPQQGPPSQEFLSTLKRQSIGIVSVAVILVLSIVFMVSTAFPF